MFGLNVNVWLAKRRHSKSIKMDFIIMDNQSFKVVFQKWSINMWSFFIMVKKRRNGLILPDHDKIFDPHLKIL